MGVDVTTEVLEFFWNGNMLKGVNDIVVSLIPKGIHAESVGDYMPITCCNTIYNAIFKILCARMKKVLQGIISNNQSAFVEGRSIVHNILICQNLARLYNRKHTTKSCLIKIDLRKAYDTVKWGFVEEMLYGLTFPCKFIKWVMECIRIPQYQITINGGLYGKIIGKKGLRQKDSISPLLFVICMEYFEQKGFAYHTKCKGLK